MSLFDVGSKIKKTAQNMSDTVSDIKDNGIGEITKGVFDSAKDGVINKIETKKNNAELAKQMKDEFQQKQSEYKSIFNANTKMGDIEIDNVNKLLKIKNAEVNIKNNSKIKSMGKGMIAMTTFGISTAVEAITKSSSVIFSFDEIADYDLLENNNSVSSGGIGRAIVGGVAFGGIGAVVGGLTGKKKSKATCDMLVLQISTSNILFPSLMINYINKEVKKSDKKYINALNDAQKTIAGLNSAIQLANNDKVQKVSVENFEQLSNEKNPYNELKQLKELLDMGIITQEEFDKKKLELL